MAIRPLNLKNQVKTLKIYPVKWSDYGLKSKARLVERPSNFTFSLKNVRFPCFFKQAFFIANTKGRHALVLFIKQKAVVYSQPFGHLQSFFNK